MARSAIAAGFEVTMYARWHPGLAPTEERDGYRVIRVPFDWRLAVPILRRPIRWWLRRQMSRRPTGAPGVPRPPTPDPRPDVTVPRRVEDRVPASIRPAGRVVVGAGRSVRRRWRVVRMFPLRPLGWAAALDGVAEPADIWHGMWAGSLPALARMRGRFGGRTIYDSRDIYMRSREFEHLGWPLRPTLRWVERRWAQSADRVLTVNDDYADILGPLLGVERPVVVMNCPERWTRPTPAPDHIRDALALPPDVAVVLYQGNLISDRGIEQSMDAILLVPDAVLVLLGFGVWRDRFASLASAPPYLGRVRLLPPVPPESLLAWTASADVTVMAIQPTTLNHRFTTPQKLFESLAAGVPVVAADLPGMARIVERTGAGALCDPTSPASIADAISGVIGASPERRAEWRERALRAAHDTYSWEAQVQGLLEMYDALLPAVAGTPAGDATTTGGPT